MEEDRQRHLIQLKEDIHRLLNDFKALVQDEGESGQETLQRLSTGARERWQETRKIMGEKGKKIDQYAHEHVWETTAIAASVGAVIGIILSRLRGRRD